MKNRHNFIVDKPEEKYHKIIYCTKCGYVCYNYNYCAEPNEKLQKNIPDCIDEQLTPHSTIKK